MNWKKLLRGILILLITVILFLIYDSFTGDRCVDLGGRWDWGSQSCEKGPDWEGGNIL